MSVKQELTQKCLTKRCAAKNTNKNSAQLTKIFRKQFLPSFYLTLGLVTLAIIIVVMIIVIIMINKQ